MVYAEVLMRAVAIIGCALIALGCSTTSLRTGAKSDPLAGVTRADLGRPCRVVVKDRVYIHWGQWPAGMVSHSGTQTTYQGVLTNLTDRELEIQAVFSGFFTEVKQAYIPRRGVLSISFLDQK